MSLVNRKVLIGVTGSIAIYRVLDLISSLKRERAEVKVILTESAMKFITPLTFTSVIGTNSTVFCDKEFFNKPLLHIELAKWSNAFIIIPASANTINKMAVGIADNLLLNVYLACKGKIAVLPAMNPTMWNHSSVKRNVKTLKDNNIEIWGPDTGKVLCGEFGLGKMLDIQNIMYRITKLLFPKPLVNKKVVLTAGPTIEEIDEVRFISNYSSGKMGYSLAKIASFLGAQVILISGPTNLQPPLDCKYIKVKNAEEMEKALYKNAHFSDILIMTAAVADFKPANKLAGKTPKNQLLEKIHLIKNNDIINNLIKVLNPKPLCIGFSIEKDDILTKARSKLLNKNLDIIIANKISENTGFNSDTNEVFIIFKDNMSNVIKIPLMDKNKLSIAIWAELLEYYANNKLYIYTT